MGKCQDEILDPVNELTGIDDVIEGVGDYVIDPITGEDKREAAEKSAEAGTKAAGRARDIAIDYNQRNLESQLESLLAREDLSKKHFWDQARNLQGGYDAAQGRLATTLASIDPVTQAGGGALSQLSALYGTDPYQREQAIAAFETSPGYQFRKAEGEKAIRRLASAKGHLGSGAMYKDLMNYGQGLASSEYGNYVGQLQSMASQFPTETLARLGISGAEYDRQLGTHKSDLVSQLGSALDLMEAQRGDARSTAYLTEGAAKSGYETTAGNLLSQLAMVPRGNVMSTISNLRELGDQIGGSGGSDTEILSLFGMG